MCHNREVIEARRSAISFIEDVVKEHKIDCNFTRRPWYFYASKKEQIPFVNKERDILKLTRNEIEKITDIPLPMKIYGAFKMNHQARFNP